MAAGDNVTRGFFIDSFPGVTLDEVHLYFASATAGDYELSLTARRDAYDGALIAADTAMVTLPANSSDSVHTAFVFGRAPVTKGDTVTFAIALVSGPGSVFYSVNTTTAGCPVTQTNGTTPPLDTFRRDGISIHVIGAAN